MGLFFLAVIMPLAGGSFLLFLVMLIIFLVRWIVVVFLSLAIGVLLMPVEILLIRAAILLSVTSAGPVIEGLVEISPCLRFFYVSFVLLRASA